MELFHTILSQSTEYQQFWEALQKNRFPISISGLSAIHRAHLTSILGEQSHRPVVVVCTDELEANRMAHDIACFTGATVPVLPSRPFVFHHMTSVSHQWEQQRLSLFHQIQQGTVPYLVTTVEAILQRTLPPDVLSHLSCTIAMGQQLDPSNLISQLIHSGYTRCDQVEGVGQFAVRGGIVDIFTPSMSLPVRIEFFGDEVDAMGSFDPASQRRVENLSSFLLLPAVEVSPYAANGGLEGLITQLEKQIVLSKKQGLDQLSVTLQQDRDTLKEHKSLASIDRYLPLIYPTMSAALDYLPPNAFVLLSESSRVIECMKSYQWQIEADVTSLLEQGVLAGICGQFALTHEDLPKLLSSHPTLYLDSFLLSSYPVPPCTILSWTAKQLPAFGTNSEAAIQDMVQYQSGNYATIVLVSSEQRAFKLQSLLQEQAVKSGVDLSLKQLPKEGEIMIAVGGLSSGLEYPLLHLAILTEGQGTIRKPKPHKQEVTNRQKLKSYADLSPGDLVVHEHHGIGRFAGMVQMQTDGVNKDYVKVAYAGSDVLYVPATQLDLISKYIGGSEEAQQTKKLSKLGGTDWEKAKKKAKKAVADLAKGLIELYAQRQRQPGFSFSPDSEWQLEFEQQFPYAETADQLRSVAEIKRDMERPVPMDRLLCGDVGYGKTEVAFRAIMKCVLDGKQAAILVPTTVLARQHYLNTLNRFSKYPVTVDVVSRFRTPAQMKETLRKVETGGVDILIGTHRLFNKDVKFKDLGLLVVDEEQRFGVQHKEHLKETFRQVDVLTLSATPIPRTLNMAMSGIRDMSTLEEPPADRLPVQTYVLEHDWSILLDAMRRELGRGGQVYYLHNRVETIDRTAARLGKMLGEDAAIGVAHGKMNQEAINDVMSRMTDGELNVLVCTTIIETGIDLPNANTLIIEDADHLGLAQLHQIRGRVGRSNRRAYAYLTYRRGKVLTEVATKRLGAIREFAEFGSGFKIAMRDLEIRGAGNILGPEQSGFMLSVGYDMYLKLLEEAVLTQQGLTPPARTECSADLTISASIPERYIPASEQRMDVYRRIAAIRSQEDADDLLDELVDRYGEPPHSVHNLMSVALLRAAASQVNITDISQRNDTLVVTLTDLPLPVFSKLYGLPQYAKRLTLASGDTPRFRLKLKKGEEPLLCAQQLVDAYTQLLFTQ